MFLSESGKNNYFLVLSWLLLMLLSACTHNNRCADLDKQQEVFRNNDFVTMRDCIDSIAASEKLDSCCALVTGVHFFVKARGLIHSDQVLQAIPFLHQSIECFRSVDYHAGEGYCHLLLATVFQKQMQVDSALYYYESSKQKLKAAGDTIGLLSVYNNLGNYLARMDNRSLAEQNYVEAEALFSSPSPLSVLLMYNIANFRLESSNVDAITKARFSLLKLLTYDEFLDSMFYSDIYNSLAATEIQLKDASMAIHYALESISYMPEASFVELQDQYENLAYAYRLAKKDAEFKDLMLRLEAIYEQLEPDNQKQYHYLAMQAALGEKAYHLEEYDHLTSNINNIGFSDKLLEVKKSFEVKEKQAQLDLLAKDYDIQKVHIRSVQWIAVILFIFFLVMTILVSLLYRERTRLRRSRVSLVEQQQRTEQVNGDLENAIRIKERLLSVIAHDLRGPLGGLKELIELYSDMPDLDLDDVRHFFSAAKDSSASVYFLLENLLAWANNRSGGEYFSPIRQDVLPLIKETTDCLTSWARLKDIDIAIHAQGPVVAQVDSNMFKTIVRNLVSNSIKYSDPGKKIDLYVECVEGEMVVSVVDQGRGMSTDILLNLFQKQDDMLDRSLSDNKVGLGLVLCSDFTGRHSGRIWAESGQGIGTKVYFTIPMQSTN